MLKVDSNAWECGKNEKQTVSVMFGVRISISNQPPLNLMIELIPFRVAGTPPTANH
jgi:hypothetical protein